MHPITGPPPHGWFSSASPFVFWSIPALSRGDREFKAQCLFHCACLDFAEDSLFLQEIPKVTAAMYFFAHRFFRYCLLRFFANSSSSCGVFCCFLMKPCSRTISSSTTTNRVRAMRLSNRERTSHTAVTQIAQPAVCRPAMHIEPIECQCR